MSQHLESLAIGDSIEVKGPIGHVHYTGNGRCARCLHAPVRCACACCCRPSARAGARGAGAPPARSVALRSCLFLCTFLLAAMHAAPPLAARRAREYTRDVEALSTL